ncbi:hypothetical protein CRE_17380 [Caenorhabditis remanei]|uniref:DUF38 domain-containing protein n=1 Tax=Caenorhabditis remanei TaxID=31234 RepID=E3N212_CAERE|nr:hypothetical protein CRE_17380 [Caenorhabditis remanei]
MPLPLSYPGLKCVLEHLEAVKRVHIIARAPGLQKVDRLIPFCLENLNIGNNDLAINKLLIVCDKDEVKFKMNGKECSRKTLEILREKMKNFLNVYIRGRSKIRLNKLNWLRKSLADFMPVDLKLKVNKLQALFPGDFETSRSLIDPRSYPLKTVATIPLISAFDNQIVTLAETLILRFVDDFIVTVEELKKLNNKTVIIECFESKIDFIPLIKYHIETKKDIRTTFRISTDTIGVINEMLREFEQAFGEFQYNLDGVDERYV